MKRADGRYNIVPQNYQRPGEPARLEIGQRTCDFCGRAAVCAEILGGWCSGIALCGACLAEIATQFGLHEVEARENATAYESAFPADRPRSRKDAGGPRR